MAGCCAAKAFENTGLEVIAFDAFNFPRKKLCGGGLTFKSYSLIQSLFGRIDFLIRGRAKKIYLINGNRVLESTAEIPFVLFVDRKELDDFLYRGLNGVAVHGGERVVSIEREGGVYRLNTTRDVYRARFVIGSDGVNSVTAKVCGINIKKALTFEMDVEADARDSALIDFSDFKSGYYWLFPKGDFYTTGFGDFSLLKSSRLEEINRKFNEKYGINGRVISKGGAFIPVFSGKLYSGKRGILLAGDAASFVDPFTGEGIYFAALSGKTAAEVILEHYDDYSSVQDAYSCFMKKFAVEFRWALFLRYLFFNFKNSMFRIMDVSREIHDVATDIISGNVTYGEAFKKFVLKSIKLPMRFVYAAGFNKKRQRKESKGLSSLDI